MRKIFVTLLCLAAPRAALACPVCFGQNDSPLASGINLGILVMLGFTGAVLVGFASFIVHLTRRARLAADLDQAGSAGFAPDRGADRRFAPHTQGGAV